MMLIQQILEVGSILWQYNVEFCLILKGLFLNSFIKIKLNGRFSYLGTFIVDFGRLKTKKFLQSFGRGALNPLTWAEILLQALVAASFGSKQGAMQSEALNKVFKLLTLGFAPDLSVCLEAVYLVFAENLLLKVLQIKGKS